MSGLNTFLPLGYIVPAVEHVFVFMYVGECKVAICENKKLREAIRSENPVSKAVYFLAINIKFVVAPS